MDSQKKLVIDDFDRQSQEYSRKYDGRTSVSHSFLTRRQRVCELAADGKGGRALDVGCGPGIMAEHLTERGFEFYGVDISREMIHQAEAKYGGQKMCHFSTGRVEKLDFPDSYFDIVICMGLVEYIEDDVAAIKEVCRVLKPGGELIVTLPNRLSPYRIWSRVFFNKKILDLIKRKILRKKAPTLFHREYREDAYKGLLTAHGLEIMDTVYYNFNIMPFPLDRLLPRLSVSVSRRLEKLCRGKLRWLGTGLIIKAGKRYGE